MYIKFFRYFCSVSVDYLPIPEKKYQLGTEVAENVGPGLFWKLQMQLQESKFVKCNLSIAEEGTVGVFGRRNIPPTVVQYDFIEILSGQHSSRIGGRSRRSVGVCNF